MTNKKSNTLARKLFSLLSFLHSKSRKLAPNNNTHPNLQKCPSMYGMLSGYQTILFDVEGGLFRSFSTFPYFMLVALEAGGLLRGLLLLLIYPLICCLSQEMGIRVMVMFTFCGLRKAGFRAGRAVLPKFYLEDVGLEGFEILRGNMDNDDSQNGSKKKVVCVSRMPRVMVEPFLKEYLEIEFVLARELKVFCGFYTGFMEDEEREIEKLGLKEMFTVEGEIGSNTIAGFSSVGNSQLSLSSYCKEICLVDKEEKRNWNTLPRDKYPKPLVFHDGRLAFKPTPINTIFLFLWFPFGIVLALIRLAIGVSLPYKLSTPILSMTGMKWRFRGNPNHLSSALSSKNRGQLFVCNHRTLIDPIYVSIAIDKQVRAVTYTLSRVSEILSPIKTVRLTRNRERDGNMMAKLLNKGELVVVCPEGTTCREPYLLRFSPLFTELSDEIVPVALDVKTSMFYATTAGGWKCFDPFFYLMNPRMCYEVEFLEKIDTSDVRAGRCRSIDVANRVQGELGRALGFECTMLTRKDKYMVLAGNDGSLAPSARVKPA